MASRPEIELIDQLQGGDLKLCLALEIGFKDQSHAAKIIQIYLKKGILEVKRKSGDISEIIPDWKVREILKESSAWQKSSEYYLALSDKGAREFSGENWKKI